MTAISRRDLLVSGAGLAAASVALGEGASALSGLGARTHARTPGALGKADWFRISLAEWSLHRTLRKPAAEGGITNLDFPAVAAKRFGVQGVEYVNAFFQSPDKAGNMVWRGQDFGYLEDLRGACKDAGVESVLIMVDGEGQLADEDEGRRREAVENHFKWVAAAAYLGCHSIRVNAAGGGSGEDQSARAADSLRRIARVADGYAINVIVENHGGLSSNGEWLAGVMRAANHDRVGTLPDFGNFYDYDRYQGVQDLMPFAKAVSAKSYDFDEAGNETKIDYTRMMKLVKDAGYRGWVGIEFEGGGEEGPGILATKALLERVRAELAG